MNILELYEKASVKGATDGVKKESLTTEAFAKFRQLLSVSEVFTNALGKTESANEFFSAFELLNLCSPSTNKEELFFAAKLGFFYEGVPSKLVYILRKALREYPTPNAALAAVDARFLSSYLKNPNSIGETSIKEIMVNLLGRDFDFLTSYRRKVIFRDLAEIYVENTDRVLIIPKDEVETIRSLEDLKSVKYKEIVGVCVGDIPIRTIGQKIGIVFDEYDYREWV